MDKEPINLIVVDDHPKARKYIGNILKTAKDIVIVGEGENGREAIELASTIKPDILLLDVELPDLKGSAVMRQIRSMVPDVKVLAISSYNDPQFILGMKENGASGYLTKDRIPSTLVDAIRSIVYDENQWVGMLAPNYRDMPSVFEQTLTKKEAEIMKQLVHDFSENTIANNLGVEIVQVHAYLELLMKKYQAKSLPELRLIARQVFPDP